MPRTSRRLLTLVALIAIAMILAACGTGAGNGDGNGNGNGDGDGDGGGPTTSAHQIGNVPVTEHEESASSTDGSAVSATATFIGFDAELPAEFVSDPYAHNVDTCDVTTIGEDFDIPFPDDVDVDINALAAGDAVTLRSGGDVYATLDVPEGGGVTATGVYVLETDLAGPAPDDVTVTVPGDEFPAFDAAALPNVDPVALTAPADTSAIGTDTTFAWTAQAGDGATYLHLSLMIGTFADATYVDCIVTDDGEFTLPTETTAELDAGFSGRLMGLSRYAVASEAKGDATLVLVSEWAADLPLF